MKPLVRIVVNPLLAAGKVWAVFSWACGSRWEILEQAGPPEYAALIVLFTGCLVTLNWSWINRRRLSVRFRELTGEIEQVLCETLEDRSHTTGRIKLANRIVLAENLRRLGIETPNPSYGPHWPSYLKKLHVYARLGNIDAARKLWAKEQEPPPMGWEWWKE